MESFNYCENAYDKMTNEYGKQHMNSNENSAGIKIECLSLEEHTDTFGHKQMQQPISYSENATSIECDKVQLIIII